MRIKMSVKPLVAAMTVVGALAASSTAMAAAPTGDFAKFKYCPYQNVNVNSCVYSSSTSGTIKLGNASVPLNAATPVILQGGVGLDAGITTWFDAANGGQTLPPARLKVPGGLLGLVSTGGWSGFLIDAFNNAVSSVNDVYSTAELVGPVNFDVGAFLSGISPAVTLPLRIHLENPFLGPSCYIGSAAHPVTFRLTTGTTTPPAGTAPITGSSGALISQDGGAILKLQGAKLVDNTFSVPAASNCGYLPLDKIIITAGVNLKEGLPSAAGKNSAILQGDSYLGTREDVAASVQ
jgi:hypothetical protein